MDNIRIFFNQPSYDNNDTDIDILNRKKFIIKHLLDIINSLLQNITVLINNNLSITVQNICVNNNEKCTYKPFLNKIVKVIDNIINSNECNQNDVEYFSF